MLARGPSPAAPLPLLLLLASTRPPAPTDARLLTAPWAGASGAGHGKLPRRRPSAPPAARASAPCCCTGGSGGCCCCCCSPPFNCSCCGGGASRWPRLTAAASSWSPNCTVSQGAWGWAWRAMRALLCCTEEPGAAREGEGDRPEGAPVAGQCGEGRADVHAGCTGWLGHGARCSGLQRSTGGTEGCLPRPPWSPSSELQLCRLAARSGTLMYTRRLMTPSGWTRRRRSCICARTHQGTRAPVLGPPLPAPGRLAHLHWRVRPRARVHPHAPSCPGPASCCPSCGRARAARRRPRGAAAAPGPRRPPPPPRGPRPSGWRPWAAAGGACAAGARCLPAQLPRPRQPPPASHPRRRRWRWPPPRPRCPARPESGGAGEGGRGAAARWHARHLSSRSRSARAASPAAAGTGGAASALRAAGWRASRRRGREGAAAAAGIPRGTAPCGAAGQRPRLRRRRAHTRGGEGRTVAPAAHAAWALSRAGASASAQRAWMHSGHWRVCTHRAARTREHVEVRRVGADVDRGLHGGQGGEGRAVQQPKRTAGALRRRDIAHSRGREG